MTDPALDLDQTLAGMPSRAPRTVAVRLTRAGARAVRRGHPWVFDGAVTHVNHEADAGAVAALYDADRDWVGLGLWDPTSPIRVKVLLANEKASIDEPFVAARVANAVALRRPLIEAEDTDGYRLVYGGSDGLPGVVADIYADTLVVKLYSAAWFPWLRTLVGALRQESGASRAVLRLARTLQGQGLPARDGDWLFGTPLKDATTFLENGLRYEVDPVRGHKTGFYLDQRDNRARVESLADGRRVLNVCAYTGGFSLAAARGGAPNVVSLDLNRLALAAASRNMALNTAHPRIAACHHETLEADAFEGLADLAAAGRAFDLVVVDPPAFARKQDQVKKAVAAYGRLASLALGVLSPGGRIVLASCSSRVDLATFRDTVERAASRAGRPLTVDEITGHPLDHPVAFPEAAYLKCVYASA